LHMSVVRRRGPLLSRAHIWRRDLGFCNGGVCGVAGGAAADLVASEAGGRASMLPPVWAPSLWFLEMPVHLAGHPTCLDSTVWDFEVKAVEVVRILGRGVLHWTG